MSLLARGSAALMLLLTTTLAGVAVPPAASGAPPICDIEDPDCVQLYEHSSTLTVSLPGMGTVTSDAPTGQTISCPGTCSVVDTITTPSPTRPSPTSPLWPTYQLTASGGPAGYQAVWSGCDSSSGNGCTATNGSPDKTVTVTGWIDVTPPTAGLSGPAKAGPSTVYTGSGSDNSGSIMAADFYVDDVLRATDTSSPFQFSPNLALLAHDSVHEVSVKLRDAAGNVSSPASKSMTIDKQVALSASTPPAFTNGPTPVTFSTDADVPNSNKHCRTGAAPFLLCEESTFYMLPVEQSTPDGSYQMDIKVTDDVGNTATVSRTTFLDRTLPEVAITSGPAEMSEVTTGSVSFSFDATDSHLATVECTLDAGTVADCDGEDVVVEDLVEGEHTFTVTATDHAGNVATAQRTFNRSFIPTTLTGSAPVMVYGKRATYSATGLPPQAEGTLEFFVGPDVVCTAPVANGKGSCTGVHWTPAGKYDFGGVTYSGDDTYAPSFDPFAVRIKQAPTRLAASPKKATVAKGNAVTLTAKLNPATATGKVLFKYGEKTLCSAKVAGGAAACTTSKNLARGSYAVKAVYKGDANHQAATKKTSFKIT